MVSVVWAVGWFDALSSIVESIVEVIEAFRTILYLLGKLLGA